MWGDFNDRSPLIEFVNRSLFYFLSIKGEYNIGSSILFNGQSLTC